MEDAAYREALRTNRLVQAEQAGERSEVVAKMQAMIDRVKAQLPADADEVRVKAELAKDEAWLKLEAKNQEMVEKIQKTLSDAREIVRRRMKKEASDLKAVKEGRAVPIAPSGSKK